MSSFRRAEGWGSAEPAPQPGDRAPSATLKQLTVGPRGPEVRSGRATSTGWASIRPEVLNSCSVALRRMGDTDVTSIAVTSTSRSEGRTTVAVGLAAAASKELRRKTILLDLDLARGAIQTTTSIGPGPGVIDFLYREATLEEILQPVDELVEVVRAGLPRDPAGTMARMGRLTDLIQQLGARCDVLIADLPPLSTDATTARVADLFESVTLVVRAGAVALTRIEETALLLTQRPFVILNGTAAPPSYPARRTFSPPMVNVLVGKPRISPIEPSLVDRWAAPADREGAGPDPGPGPFGSRMRRNFASLLMSQVATLVLTLVSLTIVPKRLGPETFGVFAFAMAFVGFFGLVASLGSNSFLVKTIARNPTQLGYYVFNALAMKAVFGSFVAGVAIVAAYVVGFPPQTVLIIEVACVGLVLGALNDILYAGLQATERFKRLAVWSAVQMYVSGAVAIGLLLDHKGIVVYTLVMSSGAAIPAIANGFQLWPEIRARMHIDLRLWKIIAVGGLPFFFWSAILLIYGSIDILMLQEMAGSKTVAWYSLAYSWVGVPVFFPSLLITVVFPSLSNKALSSSTDFSRTVNRALQLAVFVGTPMAIGIALTAGNIIGLFHYPAGFQQTIPLIRILAFHIPIVGMDMVLATALTAKDRQKAWLAVGCIAAVFNPAVNFIAIPLTIHRYGDGAIGASIVTVATEVVMMIGAIYLRPEGVLDRATLSFLVRSVAASLLMIPPVLLVANAPLAVKVAVGTVTFGIAAVSLRLVPVRAYRAGVSRVIRSFRDRGRQAPGAAAVR
jgi:O-antigen/teichoic acid export membrane protein/Mrp family chromosome partitioning ATPase